MEDWEEAILIRQESEAEECVTCPYRGDKCRSQCMEIKSVQNPYLKTMEYIERRNNV